MGPIKSLWASVQGDPVFMRKVNGWLTVFWIFMIPVSVITGWISSVTYVAALSIWALVSGHSAVELQSHLALSAGLEPATTP